MRQAFGMNGGATRDDYARDPVLYPASPVTVDCSANPYDLRPVVTAIMARVEQVSKRLRELGSTQKIILNMGENHTMPAHKLIQVLVMREMVARGHRFVFGYELPHNIAFEKLSQELDQPLNYQEKAMLAASDVNGEKALNISQALFWFDTAPVTIQSVFSTCLSLSVPFIFNDAVLCRNKIDANDPVTNSFIPRKKWYERILGQNISAMSSRALIIRNKMMVDLLSKFMDTHNVQIGIQQSGKAHVLGFKTLNDKYENSLCAQFIKADIFSVPVFVSDDSFEVTGLCNEGVHALQQGVYITGLAKETFTAETPQAEIAFIKKIAHHSDNTFPIFSPKEHLQIFTSVGIIAPEWIAEARAAVANDARAAQNSPSARPA